MAATDAQPGERGRQQGEQAQPAQAAAATFVFIAIDRAGVATTIAAIAQAVFQHGDGAGHHDDKPVHAQAEMPCAFAGLSHQALFDVASTSSGQCWSLTSYCPVPGPVPTSPANRDYEPGFTAAMMLRDLQLAQDAAMAAGARTPLGAGAAEIYAYGTAVVLADA